ncbi:MAG: mRNA surveillance protein pelota [Asgard group archaeon]|nr:mRNA surveillance protein pelota [Asgard group archaeon]
MNIKSRRYSDGYVTLVPETIDDLYVLYNIILPTDQVKSRTYRRIRQDNDSVRADKGERKSMILTLSVEEVTFHEFANRLRIKGTIIQGPEDLISYGSYHTFNIETGSLLTIIKEEWSKVNKNRLEEAVKRTSDAKILVLAIDDSEATIAAIGPFSSKTIAHFSERIPRKSSGNQKHREKQIEQFFSKIIFAIEEAIKTTVKNVTALVIAGPGFTKDNFLKRLKEARSKEIQELNQIIIESASCGGPSAIGEIISKDILSRLIEEEQASTEAQYMEEVLTRIGKNLGTVAYGDEKIKQAIEYGAIERLLILDRELRLRDESKRKALDKFLKKVENTGGKIEILSENHEAGKQLAKFGGKIALLRFPLS